MIQPGAVSVLAALLAGAACAASVVASRRRVILPALLVQFAGTALLLLTTLASALVVAYGIVGLCVCGILVVTSTGDGAREQLRPGGIPSGVSFRVVAALLVAVSSVFLAQAAIPVAEAAPPGIPVGAGLLLGLGLLQIGLSEEPLATGTALISIVGGFQVAYSTVETAIALHGLIIGIPLLIALVVAYLLVQPTVGGESAS